MNKKLKISIVVATTALLTALWGYGIIKGIKSEPFNYWWQVWLATVTVIYAIFGFTVSRRWSWLKSGVGKGVFFISLGLFFWGLGQAAWGYYALQGQEIPDNLFLNSLYFASIPFWMYGIIQLSKATGAKYGLRKLSGKILAISLFAIMGLISYYFLIVIARGGFIYYEGSPIDDIFWDLGYAVGDAINVALALTIFGLSWKYLGGRFKRPILTILFGFMGIYLADFFFSYYDGKEEYFNGHWVDLFYLIVIAIFGIALCMMDPSNPRAKIQQKEQLPESDQNQQNIASIHTNTTQQDTFVPNSSVNETQNNSEGDAQ